MAARGPSETKGATRKALQIIGAVLIGLALIGVGYIATKQANNVINDNQPPGTSQISSALLSPINQHMVENLEQAPRTLEVTIPFGAGLHGYQDQYFQPANVTINTGDTVVWVNEDTVAHTASSSVFNSGLIWPAGSKEGNFTFSQTFDKTGTFPYSCQLHPHMTGVINVK